MQVQVSENHDIRDELIGHIAWRLLFPALFGLPLIGSGPILTTGNVFFVNRAHPKASNGNLGTSPDKPLATIDFAIGLCTANNGDYIIVGPGHTESILVNSGIAVDVAGVSIIGLGTGSNRPTYTFTTANTATIPVSANNMSISKIAFIDRKSFILDPGHQSILKGITFIELHDPNPPIQTGW